MRVCPDAFAKTDIPDRIDGEIGAADFTLTGDTRSAFPGHGQVSLRLIDDVSRKNL
jgi:hypothetical protein